MPKKFASDEERQAYFRELYLKRKKHLALASDSPAPEVPVPSPTITTPAAVVTPEIPVPPPTAATPPSVPVPPKYDEKYCRRFFELHHRPGALKPYAVESFEEDEALSKYAQRNRLGHCFSLAHLLDTLWMTPDHPQYQEVIEKHKRSIENSEVFRKALRNSLQ